MLIDWFTVGAQALNFVILVWLMRRFLYKPILHAIDEREKRIASELADAAAKKTEAHKERDEFQQKNAKLDEERASLMTKAADEAKAERERLLAEARKAADAASAKRQETLKSDAHSLNRAIARRAQDEVFAIARKTLEDLASVPLEARACEVFIRRLRALDEHPKSTLGAALKNAPEPAVVRTAFELPAEERARVQRALNETFSADIHLRFETAPELVSGIELATGGQKLAWSIADYLRSLEKSVGVLVETPSAPQPDATVKTDGKPKPAAENKPTAKPDEHKPAPTP